MGGLVRRHDQVILRSDIVAAIARPTNVESLPLDRATGHVDQLADDANLGRVIQVGIFHHRAVDQGKRQIAGIDGKADAFGEMHARLAAAQLRLVGDVVMDKGCRVKMLDGGRGAGCQTHIPANRAASRETDKRAMTLAAVLAVLLERIIQVAIHIRMSSRWQIAVNQVADLVRIERKVLFEGLGGFCDVCDDIVDILHKAFLSE